jgi:hypothetical protein
MDLKIEEGSIKDLAFDDFSVTSFEFFPERKILKIEVDGAWFKELDALGGGLLTLKDWSNLAIQYYNNDTDTWYKPDLSDVDALREICEFKTEGSIVYLWGFGRIGWWNEWRIENPKMTAVFHDRKKYLLSTLLNKNIIEKRRSEAAMEIKKFKDLEIVQALIQTASNSSEDIALVVSCAKSLGGILSSETSLYNEELVEKLTSRTKEIVNDIIRNKNPSFLKSPS